MVELVGSKVMARRTKEDVTHQTDTDVEDNEDTPHQKDYRTDDSSDEIVPSSEPEEDMPYVTPIALQRKKVMPVTHQYASEVEDSEVERENLRKRERKKSKRSRACSLTWTFWLMVDWTKTETNVHLSSYIQVSPSS